MASHMSRADQIELAALSTKLLFKQFVLDQPSGPDPQHRTAHMTSPAFIPHQQPYHHTAPPLPTTSLPDFNYYQLQHPQRWSPHPTENHSPYAPSVPHHHISAPSYPASPVAVPYYHQYHHHHFHPHQMPSYSPEQLMHPNPNRPVPFSAPVPQQPPHSGPGPISDDTLRAMISAHVANVRAHVANVRAHRFPIAEKVEEPTTVVLVETAVDEDGPKSVETAEEKQTGVMDGRCADGRKRITKTVEQLPVTASSEEKVTMSTTVVVQPVSSKALSPPQRPGYGTIGKKCFVRANHFLVKFVDKDLRFMYCKDLRTMLTKEDVPRVLGILKVSAAIGFEAAVLSCLEYLEAAPWTEDEEEKVASLLSELQWLDLENLHQLFDKMIQKASTCIPSGDASSSGKYGFSSELFTRDDSFVPKSKAELYDEEIGTGTGITFGFAQPQIVASTLKPLSNSGQDRVKLSLISLANWFLASYQKGIKELNLQDKLLDQVEWLPDSIGKLSTLTTLALSQVVTFMPDDQRADSCSKIPYGLDKKAYSVNIPVFDLGGGTFDVSVLTIDNGVFEVLATSGDTQLGGENFDHRVMDYFITLIKKKRGKDVSKDNKTLGKFLKEWVIYHSAIGVEKFLLYDNESDGKDDNLRNVVRELVEEGVFSDTGWYATNQFAMNVIFSNKMKQYECLTNDSSLVAAIFVPFYAGFDIARYIWGYNISVRDAASLELVDWLMKRPEWKIMGGKGHFLVAGRITWDFRRLSESESDWGNKLLFLPAARNMSMLVVESSPWYANDLGIPYPTYFHPAKDAEVFMWQDRMRKLERKWLFSFAGAPRPGNPKSIRGQIIGRCRESKFGKLRECDFGKSKCHSPSSIMQMFQGSLFYLQPQGNSYTRRSAFDSMLAGCIPAFFHPGQPTLSSQHFHTMTSRSRSIRKGMVMMEHGKQVDGAAHECSNRPTNTCLPSLLRDYSCR